MCGKAGDRAVTTSVSGPVELGAENVDQKPCHGNTCMPRHLELTQREAWGSNVVISRGLTVISFVFRNHLDGRMQYTGKKLKWAGCSL